WPYWNAFCRSSIVISSSSKSFLKSVTASVESATPADPSAGETAVARVVATPAQRKSRREVYFERKESVGIKAPAAWMSSVRAPERESYEERKRKANPGNLVRRNGQGPLSCPGRDGSLTKLSGSSSAVERQLPKLDVTGSIPVSRSIFPSTCECGGFGCVRKNVQRFHCTRSVIAAACDPITSSATAFTSFRTLSGMACV